MSHAMRYVLITGTNGGLGQGICTRLIDDFLQTQPATDSLTIIFTTRSSRKSADTLKAFKAHLSQHHPAAVHNRIHFQPESLELTSLLSIRALTRKLLASDIPHLNTVILNAGIGGWAGVDWFQAVPDILLDIVSNTTWPAFKLGIAGLITGRQFPDKTGAPAQAVTVDEPVLGQIFCANVFGHYMLAHWLMPLLRTCAADQPGLVIWVSSIEPRRRHLDEDEDDIMGLKSKEGYETSKRLTDLLALTFDRQVAKGPVTGFVAVDEDESHKRELKSTPSMHVAHPGVCTTTIMSLFWIIQYFYALGIYMARWAGSPWATVSTYLAAVSYTWLTLAPAAEIAGEEAKEGNGGRVKWGSAVTRSGTVMPRPTDVEGWGINGCGEPYVGTWWGGRYGRAPGARDATGDDVAEFQALGGRMWTRMEQLRVEWEERIEEYEKTNGVKR